MTRILIVKLSSMGDVIHALPVLADIKQALGDVQIDWLIEPHYAPLLQDHPYIDTLHIVSLREHKKKLSQFFRSPKVSALKKAFKENPYDIVLDLQGLLKSAWLSRWAKGCHHGYDFSSAREPLSALFYNRRHKVSKDLHAITRMRQLAAYALGYPCPTDKPNYGFKTQASATKTIMLIPNTAWTSKQWPVVYWQTLAKQLSDTDFTIQVAWGTEEEQTQAIAICQNIENIKPIEPADITQMKSLLQNCSGFVGCDTGFSHLATALDIPGIMLMGPTDEKKHGPLGEKQIAMHGQISCRPCHQRVCPLSYAPGDLQPACMAQILPEHVFKKLLELM